MRAAQAQAASVAPVRYLYLYGIVDRLIHPGLLAGAARGGQLDVTAAGRIAAVHTEIDAGELAELEPDIREGSRLADLARRHDEVVTALALAGPVLPMRLGTVLADRAALGGLLESTHAGLTEALDRLRGRAEWRVRVTGAGNPGDQPAESAASGTAYLFARRAARRRADDQRAAIAALDEALTSLADATAGPRLAAAGPSPARSYLVPGSIQEAFVAVAEEGVARLAEVGGTALLLGPSPAYSFADLQLGRLDDDRP